KDRSAMVLLGKVGEIPSLHDKQPDQREQAQLSSSCWTGGRKRQFTTESQRTQRKNKAILCLFSVFSVTLWRIVFLADRFRSDVTGRAHQVTSEVAEDLTAELAKTGILAHVADGGFEQDGDPQLVVPVAVGPVQPQLHVNLPAAAAQSQPGQTAAWNR